METVSLLLTMFGRESPGYQGSSILDLETPHRVMIRRVSSPMDTVMWVSGRETLSQEEMYDIREVRVMHVKVKAFLNTCTLILKENSIYCIMKLAGSIG